MQGRYWAHVMIKAFQKPATESEQEPRDCAVAVSDLRGGGVAHRRGCRFRQVRVLAPSRVVHGLCERLPRECHEGGVP